MSVENVKKFYEALARDDSLRQKLTDIFHTHQFEPLDAAKAARLVEQEILPLATELGFSFTTEELKQHELTLWQSGALSETDLQNITGGNGTINFAPELQSFLTQITKSLFL